MRPPDPNARSRSPGDAPPAEGPPWDLPIQRATFAFVDLEMTGLRLGEDRVVEVCFDRVRDRSTIDRFDTVIEAGMTFTVEPMLTLGTYEWDIWDDGWTVTTKDKSRTAQFEHTILVTSSGPEILTQP